MELPNPERLEIDGVSLSLLDNVSKSARKINELRPPDSTIPEGFVEGLLGERVYRSNAIEGNTLDLEQTKEILRTGHAYRPRTRDTTEALNLGRAIEHVQHSMVSPYGPFSVDELLSAHRMILVDINGAWAGRLRNESVMIRGAKHQPPDWGYVPELLDEVIRRLNDTCDVHPVILAAWAHWCLARIHPFYDGNGRVARLWQDVVLFRHRLTCALIGPDDRDAYMLALQQADDGDFNPVIQLIARSVLHTLDLYLQEQQEEMPLTITTPGLDARPST